MRLLPLQYATRNLGRSRLRLALSVGGAAIVVLLVLAAGAFVRGMTASLREAGSPDNVILLGAGSEESIERSEIGAAVGPLVEASVPGIRATAGVPHVSIEVHVGIPLRLERDGAAPSTLTLVRGVTPGALLVYRHVQIVEGRFPEAGRGGDAEVAGEVMVGRMAASRLGVEDASLTPGRRLWLDDKAWTIVGRFAAPGTVMESEVWAPLTDLKIATKRTTDSCVVLALDPAAGAEFEDVDAFAKRRLDLELAAIRETAYYDKLSEFFGPIRAVAWATAALIAAGAALGGLNTMYAAFAARVRELGMLQCLGYRRAAIALSLVQESVLAASAGAIIGCAVGVLLLDGVSVSFSMGAFGLKVDATVVAGAMAAGVLLGLVGALPPAWRALRLPIPESLKAV